MIATVASTTCQQLEEHYYFQESSTTLFPKPVQLMHSLNHTIYNTGHPDYLMTFILAQINLETGLLTFSNASHNFPLLIHKDGDVKHLLNSNKRLGDQIETEFTEACVSLEFDDLLFLYTDGLIERENHQGEMWGERRLIQSLKKHRDLSVQETLECIVEDASQFYQDSKINDDITIVACKVTSPFSKKP